MKSIFYAPEPVRTRLPRIFLAGTIDQGASRDWQKELGETLSAYKVAVVNPRRPQWNASWGQGKPIHKELKKQIQWEMRQMDKTDLVAMWLEPTSKSPITLLELGLFGRVRPVIVGCPPGFYRYANVVLASEFLGVPVYESWEDFSAAVTACARKLSKAKR